MRSETGKCFGNQSTSSFDETTYSKAKRFESSEISNLAAIGSLSCIRSKASGSQNDSGDLLSPSSPSLGKTKKFGDRPDVIYKTILRSFKKFYLADFNKITDYKRKKRRVANDSFLIEMASDYASATLAECPFEEIELFIAALVQPKLPPTLSSNSKLVDLSKTVCEVLYRFNKSKMNDLLSYPQFSYLLHKFLSMPDAFEYIGERTNSPQAQQNLKAQIRFIQEK